MGKTSDRELHERVDRERIAHDERDVLAENIRIKSRFAHIERYPSKIRFFNRIDSYLEGLEGKHILDYGCGRGDAALDYVRRAGGGAASPESISHPYSLQMRKQKCKLLASPKTRPTSM